MIGMFTPTKREKEELNKIIFEMDERPFSVKAYIPGQKVSDFVGRKNELYTLREQTKFVWRNKISRAVRLEGPAGVGKSTLFIFLKESIESERISIKGPVTYLSKDTDILSSYLQVPDKIEDFGDIWKELLIGFEAGVEEETRSDIGLMEYIALHLIYRMFKEDNQGLSTIIWPEREPGIPFKYVGFIDIIDPILDGGANVIKGIQEYFNKNKREIRGKLKTEVNNVKYEIKRGDTSTIVNLFRVLNEDDSYLDQLKNRDSSIFRSSQEIIRYFNDLMRFYACATRKQPLLLLGLDEVTKTSDEIGKDHYLTLANLFVRLRNNLKFVLFVFISTTEDWVKFDNVIRTGSDLSNQINAFVHRIPLQQLSVEEMTEVFKNRMRRYWETFPSNKSTRAPFYPFSESLFNYVFRYQRRNLRNSIQFLDRLWSHFRRTRNVPNMLDLYSSMRVVRSFTKQTFDPENIERFEWDLIEKSFNEPTRFRSNSVRSSTVERGLEAAWRCLQMEPASSITKVENNPVIETSTISRRPDVCIEIHGNLGAEYRRFVEFQVKAYDEKNKISLDHIESSIQLFKEHFTDYLYFIITGKGLDSKAEYSIKQLEYNYPNRILRPPLTKFQEQNLYLLALFEEITGHPLGRKPDIDIVIAKKILSNILNRTIEDFIAKIGQLSYRKPLTESIIITTLEPKEIPVATSNKDLDQFIPSEPIQTTYVVPEKPETGKVSWLNDYSMITRYKYEACALCSYLKSRETGRYKHKFTQNTVLKNVIRKDATTSPEKFKDMIKLLKQIKFVEMEKSSLKLTPGGLEFYNAVKADDYQC